MKKIFLTVAIFATAFVHNTFAQDSTIAQPSQLLNSYYDIKNALVADNSSTASNSAAEFVKTLKGIDSKLINDPTLKSLLKDGGQIAESKDIKHQREHFCYILNKYVRFS